MRGQSFDEPGVKMSFHLTAGLRWLLDRSVYDPVFSVPTTSPSPGRVACFRLASINLGARQDLSMGHHEERIRLLRPGAKRRGNSLEFFMRRQPVIGGLLTQRRQFAALSP